MKEIALLLFAVGCGGPAYRCHSSVFGGGFESYAPMACATAETLSGLAAATVARDTGINPDLYASRMQNVTVFIHSVPGTWTADGTTVTGYESGFSDTEIQVSSAMESLLHESLHSYTRQGLWATDLHGRNLDSHHHAWEEAGYFAADLDFAGLALSLAQQR
jgi:hypothetical protein